ncbi:MAG: GNAT family N-acetyltransferase [Ilumatobacter sp.]
MHERLDLDIRSFEAGDRNGWVRCRALSFLATSYFDDVKTSPTVFSLPSVRLVATLDELIVGLIDIEVDDELATIDSIAVHPDFQGRGIATALLGQAITSLPDTVVELDAWTREDRAVNSWYRANNFKAEQHYLHVYKAWNEDLDAKPTPTPKLRIVGAFMHASLEDESEMRSQFRRVHVCRRYVRVLIE